MSALSNDAAYTSASSDGDSVNGTGSTKLPDWLFERICPALVYQLTAVSASERPGCVRVPENFKSSEIGNLDTEETARNMFQGKLIRLDIRIEYLSSNEKMSTMITKRIPLIFSVCSMGVLHRKHSDNQLVRPSRRRRDTSHGQELLPPFIAVLGGACRGHSLWGRPHTLITSCESLTLH